jgi:hypothetical protein
MLVEGRCGTQWRTSVTGYNILKSQPIGTAATILKTLSFIFHVVVCHYGRNAVTHIHFLVEKHITYMPLVPLAPLTSSPEQLDLLDRPAATIAFTWGQAYLSIPSF